MTTFYAPETGGLRREPSVADKVDDTVYLLRQVMGVGVVAGLRSMAPLALITQARKKERYMDDGTALSFLLDTPGLRQTSVIMALAEIVGDKLPIMPGRLRAVPLLMRLAIGASAGALLCHQSRQSVVSGIALGAAGAGLGTIAGYMGRTFLVPLTGIPDAVWGMIEDGIALKLGQTVVDKHARLCRRKQA